MPETPLAPGAAQRTRESTDVVRLKPKQSLLVGVMLFGLFFGAGNLIFPVEMGRAAGSHTMVATVGFLLTATALPVLGIMASAMSGSSSMLEMASRVSRPFAVFFTCALYLTIGPLFAIPRTATVSYEIGLSSAVPSGSGRLALALFTVVFFLLTALAALRPGRLIDWIGRYLTPAFLVLLAALIVIAFVRPMTHGAWHAPTGPYTDGALGQGFLDGYNTMDALASLAFAVVVIDAVKRLGVVEPRRIAVETAKSGIVSIVGMAVIYASLAYIGVASWGAVREATNGGTALAAVSRHYFGDAGQVLIALIVLAACLKTAIGLVTACAEMFTQMFPRALSYRNWVLVFTGVSLAIANVGLKGIIEWSTPVLVFLYPIAIATILLGLLTPWLRERRVVDRCVIGFVTAAALFDLVKALPVEIPGSTTLTSLAQDVLPGYANGFGWVVPGAVGLVVGLMLSAQKASAR